MRMTKDTVQLLEVVRGEMIKLRLADPPSQLRGEHLFQAAKQNIIQRTKDEINQRVEGIKMLNKIDLLDLDQFKNEGLIIA